MIFTGLTVIVLASNERESLIHTLHGIVESCDTNKLYEIIVALKSADCPSAETLQRTVKDGYYCGIKIRSYFQKNSDVFLFFSELPQLVNSSHFVIMASDLEMDPASLKAMLEITVNKPECIVCASKWHKESEINGIGWLEKTGSRITNRLVAFIIGSGASDLFSIYQIYPKHVFDLMEFSEPSKMLVEYTLKPVLNGIGYIEIPTVYCRRKEGRSHFRFAFYVKLAFRFLYSAIKLRFFSNGTIV